MSMGKRIAIVGSGISGLVATYFLGQRHDVTLFEQNLYVGGHTNTIDVSGPNDTTIPVDTGFIVFNDRTYPGFNRLLDHLGIEALNTTMSFSVQCGRTGIEYCGSSLNGLFAQRRNLLRPSFYKFLSDFRRFGKQAGEILNGEHPEMTVGEFFRRNRYGEAFYQRYFLPMGASIWSCPTGIFEEFPIQFIARFYHHHGLLGVRNRPQWKVVRGGSRQYVNAICRRLANEVATGLEVTSVRRTHGESATPIIRVEGVRRPSGERFVDQFDHVVLACHADQAMQLVQPPADSWEQHLLKQFPYQPNIAVLHTDESVMPRSRRAWAAWNYAIPKPTTEDAGQPAATLTYDMNCLQRLGMQQTDGKNYFVTLNSRDQIADNHVLREIQYAHPVFQLGRDEAQANHDRVIDIDGLSYCGAYWGNGFHEDGVQSALRVCKKLLGSDPWKLLSTSATSSTAAKLRPSIDSAIAYS